MENNQSNEIRTLKMQVAKLQLESKLRRNLASEIDKQKQIAKNAEEIAKEKSREIEGIASQLSKYLSPQLFNSIFSGEKKVLIESERKFLTVFFSDIVCSLKAREYYMYRFERSRIVMHLFVLCLRLFLHGAKHSTPGSEISEKVQFRKLADICVS